MKHPTKQRYAAVLLSAVLATGLAGCATEDAKTSEKDSNKPVAADGPQILRISDAKELLLTGPDIGKGFKSQPDIPDLEADTNGCLGIFDQAQTNQQFEVESQFVRDGVTVTSQVSTYSTVGAPKGDILRFRKALRSCKQFTQTRSGADYDVELIFNETTTNDDAQDQLNVLGTGSITANGVTQDLSYRYTLTRIENNIVGIQIASMGPNPDELSELIRLNDLLVERLGEMAGLPGDETEDADPSEDPTESEDSDDTADALGSLAAR